MISIFPNPATNQFQITLNTEMKEVELDIVDLNGKIIMKNKISSVQNTVEISRFNPGIYFVKVVSQNNFEVFKLVINPK